MIQSEKNVLFVLGVLGVILLITIINVIYTFENRDIYCRITSLRTVQSHTLRFFNRLFAELKMYICRIFSEPVPVRNVHLQTSVIMVCVLLFYIFPTS